MRGVHQATLLAVLEEEARESLERADDPRYLPELRARAVHRSRGEPTELRTRCPAAAEPSSGGDGSARTGQQSLNSGDWFRICERVEVKRA